MQWGLKASGGKAPYLIYTTDDKQKGHMGTPVKNILKTLLIDTSSNLKEKVMRIKTKVFCTTKHVFTV